ncbi:hypothetical protein TNCV_4324671 [Trichonephila clavipes]|nr:hypothetical protein TNCV_4324671 [Trichonephila clavipes]
MLDHLEDNIRRVIADIRPQMLEKVIENWTSRLNYIRASRGSPMPEIIFKIQRSLSDKRDEEGCLAEGRPLFAENSTEWYFPIIRNHKRVVLRNFKPQSSVVWMTPDIWHFTIQTLTPCHRERSEKFNVH